MIRNLRGKIVAMTMGVLVLLFLVAYAVAQYGVGRAMGQITRQVLQTLAEGTDGIRSEDQIQLDQTPLGGVLTLDREELLGAVNMPIYGLETDPGGGVLDFAGLEEGAEDLSPGERREIQNRLRSAEPGCGEAGRFRYYKAEKDYGYYIVLADRSRGLEKEIRRHVGAGMIAVGTPLLLLMFLVSVVLSHFVAKPTEAAFQKQKQFVSDAGHELKTPLSVINVNAAVLESEIGSNKYMDCIKEESARMSGLIRQMLDVACIEDGDRSAEKKRFSLSEAVYQSALPFESMAFERGIRYETEIQEDCFFVGEPERIRQVMAILLDNAFKYGEEGGTVSVRLRREGRRLVIEVYNTGQGIAPADLPHIFERFYRCDKARAGNGSYGLGLAIAQSIVQANKGSITAESEAGAWTRFRVAL